MEHSQTPLQVSVTPLSVIWYALGGCAVGLILGMLYAPKSGEETRQDLADMGRRSREKSRAMFDRFRGTKAGEAMEEAAERAQEAVRS